MAPNKMFRPQQAGSAHTAGIFADMTVDGPIIGDLVVVVDRARNLPNRKTMGKQDPYCAARLGKEAKKTETDRRGGQTPKWDQELRFVVHDSADYLKLKLSIFNEDRKTELIGETWIDLKDVVVRGGGQNDGWHRLNCKGRPSGEVRMEITFYDTREKPDVPASKPSRQAEQLNGGPREMPGRRLLPRGPGAADTVRKSMPHAASTSQLPTRPHPAAEGAMPRHMSADATELGPVDPHEHRRRMMIAHGVPFDPHAKAIDERLAHHGGPRPVPGQGFSDLDRLRYRNRGVVIPEGLMEDQEQRSRRNTYETPGAMHHELHLDQSPQEQPVHDFHPSHPQAPYPLHDDYMPDDHQAQDAYYQPYDPNPQLLEQQPNYLQPSIEEDEGPPPPPPAHRSHIMSTAPVTAPAQYEPEPPAPSLQHGLARLNARNGDDFYHPIENSTQLTTHSDMPAPGYADDYNHGHRTSPRALQGAGNFPNHQRSMQDMRGHPTDFRSSGLPAAGHRGYAPSHDRSQRDSGYGSFGQLELADPQVSHPPIVKPRPISPNASSPYYRPPPITQPSTPQHAATPPSASSSIPRKSVEPRLSDIAFSPDSFDVLNPQIKTRPDTANADSMTQSPYANSPHGGDHLLKHAPTNDPSEPIRDSLGRLVDPSDHLPTHTWAPEPEPKKPLKTEVKLRFKGAVPMPSSGPRAARPDVGLPAVKSSVLSPHLNEKPSDASSGDANGGGRNRLQKKVRVLMTTGGRKQRKAVEREAEADRLGSGLSQPLRDIPNVNGSFVGHDAGPPPIPSKIPLDNTGYEENSGMGMDELSREISSIDLGAYSGAGSRGDRRRAMPATLM